MGIFDKLFKGKSGTQGNTQAPHTQEQEKTELQRSGLLSRFVREKNGAWNHGDWLGFLVSVRNAGFRALSDEEVGFLLEREKANFFQTRQPESEFGKRDDTVIITIAETLAGGWPPELSRDIFNRINLDKLVACLLDYRNRNYRFPDPTTGLPDRPKYFCDDGKVQRMSNPVHDITLVQTASFLAGRRRNAQNFNDQIQENARYAVDVIQHYAAIPLAKFLFSFLTAFKVGEALAQGGEGFIVGEPARLAIGVQIDIYTGVENLLLEIWDELGEGQTFDDNTVKRKLLSIVESARV
jgi:hypothetical protein